MNSLAYLSGFPASLKETEQLRVKLPPAITGKINQVKRVCAAVIQMKMFRLLL